jgi:bifunctional non-homologous end joining protein LigD
MTRSSADAKLRDYRRKRDFARTPEPSGDARLGRGAELEYVVQKHAASQLHFDLRLEMGGVMKSWAVPKGPSLDPSVKRLAVEVEDHPIEYNGFEGTIPEGGYGAGTVMLWDRGTYVPEDAELGEAPESALQRGYREGRIAFTVQGERLHGSFTLVRTDRGEAGGRKPQWLLIKRADDFADPEHDVVEEVSTSVATSRTMDEIATGNGKQRVWRSSRGRKPRIRPSPAKQEAEVAPGLDAITPMLCQTAQALPEGDGWTYEPKYDGIRVLAFATADAASLVTRNRNEKASQFPEVVEELRRLARDLAMPLVLDGEIVGLGAEGELLRFGSLQGRMHVTGPSAIGQHARESPAGFVAFDLLLAGNDVLMSEPWSERRRRLEALLDGHAVGALRLAESSSDGEAMLSRGERSGWEGIVAKRADARYRPGMRSEHWLKLKIENRQEFVVGGWTEPRGGRQHLGAILLGYHDADGNLVYAGHTGTGLTRQSLATLHRRLKRLERKTPPFQEEPRTNEPAHWTTPRVVVEIRFNEWTADGKLRQPVFLGLRDDRNPRSVVREPASARPEQPARKRGRKTGKQSLERDEASAQDPFAGNPRVKRIRQLEQGAGGGEVPLDRGRALALTNLRKVFYPKEGHTKGDLLAYYAGMAEHILPWMRDRPLVLKRHPNGIRGKFFYQQTAPDEVPQGVRTEMVQLREEKDPKPRLVGGNLATLLYTIQLGAISYDPWHSRMKHLASADYTILDLDPGPGTSFSRVVQVARRIKEELDAFGLHGGVKTSGSSGIHIYLPLQPDTPLEAATLVAQLIATRVAQKHPREATVERMRKNRPVGTVYVDYLQNILGKTVSGVYAVRAKPGAPVSAPLRWDELTDDLDLRDFTIQTVPARVREMGDLWASVMEAPNSLDALLVRR